MSTAERRSVSAIDAVFVASSSLGFFIVEVLLKGCEVHGRVWGIGLSDLTIESFNSTRTGLKSSAEGSLTRCVVGHQESGGAVVPKVKLNVEDALKFRHRMCGCCAGGPVQHVAWG